MSTDGTASSKPTESVFQTCFGNSPVATVLYDTQGYLLEANQALVKLMGVEKEQDLVGLKIQDNPSVPSHLGEHLLSGQAITFSTTYDFDSVACQTRLKTHKRGLVQMDCTITPWLIPDSGEMGILGFVQDMTEHKSIAHRLEMLSRAIEQGSTTIVITDTASRIEYVNAAFCRSSGYSEKEVMGQNPRILKSGLMTPDTYRRIYAQLKQGESWSGEFLNKKKSGELYWEMCYISPIRDPDGVIRHFMAVKEDITDRKMAKGRLELQFGVTRVLASEEKLDTAAQRLAQALLDSLTCSFVELWFLNQENGDLVCRASAVTNFAQDSATPGCSSVGNVIPVGSDFRHKALRALGSTRVTTSNLRSLFIQPIRGDKGPSGLIVVGDILNVDTQLNNAMGSVAIQIHQFILRLKAEHELRQLALVAQRSSNLVIITSPDGHITWVNEGFERITGYALAEVQGKRAPDLLHGPLTQPDVAKAITEACANQREIRVEIINYTKAGAPYWSELLIQPNFGTDQKLINFVAIGSDISRRKAVEEDLSRAREDALHAIQEKNQFLENLSEELLNPVHAILGSTSTLTKDFDLEEDHLEHVKNIAGQATRLRSLVDAIRDVSGKVEIGASENGTLTTGLAQSSSAQMPSSEAPSVRATGQENQTPPMDSKAGELSIRKLPTRGSLPPLLYGIYEASLVADIGKLLNLVDLLEMKDPAMASRFRKIASSYDYEPILSELDKLIPPHV